MQSGMTALASCQAGEIVTQIFTQNELIIISGLSGAGKSTWCQEAVTRAQAVGLKVAGLISPAVYENGQKVGIDLIDIKTNERRLLARRKQSTWDRNSCNWDFDERTCIWANQVLRGCSSAEVLFIDELGPRELLHGDGFQEGMRLLDNGHYESAFVVIRPRLLRIARQRWPNLQLVHLHKKAL